MMEGRKAGDLMIPLDKYPHIPYWFTLRQAMAEFENSSIEINGQISLPRIILVFDEKYQLMGMARRRDILRGLEPEFLSGKSYKHPKKLFDVGVDPNLSEMSYDKLLKAIRERAESKVSDIMVPIKETVDYDDHIMKVIYEMVSNDLSMLPVMQEGSVAGVVRSVDIFHEVAQLII
ncbi:MAG: CBS domain-containing protein [candidate division Zixibacteria bacterium]|nr:CBS domain-containing protein [candidate division Zixibacteria bacterium]